MKLKVKINGTPADFEIDDTDWPAAPVLRTAPAVLRTGTGAPDYLTADELAAALNVSRATISRRTRRRLIPYRRIGGAIRFKLAEVEAALVKINAR